MKGKHHVAVYSSHLKYEFDIFRNITVIQGDSATGKTTLVELLREHQARGDLSPVKVESDVPCIVFTGDDSNWKVFLGITEHSIVFIDEGFSFIFSKEFAEEIQKTDNYYVLITRRPVTCLPYSIKEIYGIRTSGKYHYPEQVYHEFYKIYDNIAPLEKTAHTIFITEDSKSGYQFISSCCKTTGSLSAEGNSNIYNTIRNISSEDSLVVIADGAAFGAFIEKILAYASIRRNISLFLPESFEWIVLSSGIIKDKHISEILSSPEKYIESANYFSWERFFTGYLEQATAEDPVRRYTKQHLNSFYTEGRNREQIIDVFPDSIKALLE